MQVNRCLHLSKLSSPSLGLNQKKNRPEKFPFTATNNLIVFAVRWSVKYFLLQTPRYCGKENGENQQIHSILLFKQTQFHPFSKSEIN